MSGTRRLRALTATLAAAALALAGVVAAPGVAAADAVTVSGTVSLTPGRPSLVWVTVYDEAFTEQVAYATASNETGEYSLQVEPGTYNFSVYAARDHDNGAGQYARSGTTTYTRHVVVDGNTTVDLRPTPLVTVDVSLVDTSGNDIPTERWMECRQGLDHTDAQRDDQRVGSSQYDPNQHLLVGMPIDTSANDGSGCQLILQPTEEPYAGMALSRDHLVFSDEPNQELTVVLPDTATVTGHITGPTDPPFYYGARVQAHADDGTFYNITSVDPEGNYSIQVAPGDYHLTLPGGSYDHNIFEYREVTVPAGGTTLDSTVSFVPYKVHAVGADGQPGEASLEMECRKPFRGGPEGSQVHSRAYGTGELQLYGTNDAGYTCTIDDISVYPNPTWTPDFGPDGGEVTYLTSTHEVIDGPPEASNDDDGVPDVVEGLGPNGGDGNDDGTPDNQQAHVTSLPAKGAAPGEETPYVTLAGPAGSTLVDVTTSDVADADTPPPSGTTLPAGLTSFTLTGVTPGSTQTVSVYGGPMAGVNGYAKYDPDSATWTSLPANRVQVLADHVDISLTDGGIGDDDNSANGSITDPGGIAVLPVVSGDTSPPVVTGRATTQPNAAGWYRGNVRIDWTATDPGSGVTTQPPDTTVSTEGANVTATSPLVCDKAPTPNCGHGTLNGLKIDKTAPAVSVTGVSNGATYTLGSAPTPGCSATDPLSGLVRPCAGVKGGGNKSGVGTFTYAATATDKAGNTRVVSASYRVAYRFDGFAQPLNDPATPLSVFKLGSTVPVAFTLKRANGTTVTPVSKPTWVTPVRGARTTAPVNESMSTAKVTSGSAFVWANNRWTYNWSTKGLASGYLYRIGVRLDDGTTHYLNVGVR
jgi:hypothetical protein